MLFVSGAAASYAKEAYYIRFTVRFFFFFLFLALFYCYCICFWFGILIAIGIIFSFIFLFVLVIYRQEGRGERRMKFRIDWNNARTHSYGGDEDFVKIYGANRNGSAFWVME